MSRVKSAFAPPSAWRRFMWLGLTLGAMAIVIGSYHWTVRTSGGFNPPGEEDYYNFLVRGWRGGHLYLSKEPVPEMSKLADPYDPAQNAPYRLADASYFKGHYYLYFGAVPAALIMLPYYYVTGSELGTTTTIFIFAVIGFLASSLLWLQIRRHHFRQSAAWLAPLGILVLGFGSHVLALQRRPLVWELPIVSAYAFTSLGLLLVHRLIVYPRTRLALGAGLCFGLAVASRPTYLFATLAIIPACWYLWFRSGQGRQLTLGLLGVFSLCLTTAFAHNYARFGHFLEFGQNYQLTGIYESKATHFRPSYFVHNVGIYYFQPPTLTREFPFISATVTREGPPGYLGSWNEPVCGIALTLPFLWLALAVPWSLGHRNNELQPEYRILLGSIVLSFLGLTAVTLSYFLATPRYMADFTPTLALLACLGAAIIERKTVGTWWRRPTVLSMVALGAVTTLSGLLMSTDYHGRLLKTLSPQEWHTLERAFHFFSTKTH